MHILITAGNNRWVRQIAVALARRHTVRLFDHSFEQQLLDGIETATGDSCDPTVITQAVAGVNAILHFAPYLAGQDHNSSVITALDEATRGTFVLANAARQAAVGRIVLASTLEFFDRYPAHYQVNEVWRPRPTPAITQLAPWLGELSLRESTRRGPFDSLCLRLGKIVDDIISAQESFDARWVHIDDVVAGIECALRFSPEYHPSWSLFHIMAPGPRSKLKLKYSASASPDFGYAPTHDFQSLWSTARLESPPLPSPNWRDHLAPHQIRSRPIRRVVIFGAGGPMGAVTTQELASSYPLRITDIRPITEIAAQAKPQAPGAPLPIPLGAPHETRLVDVRNPQQVMDAVLGMDAIINTTVVRPHPVDAFLVNTIGAYNVMAAAVAHKIRRVVHTGPLVQHLHGIGDHSGEYDLHVDAPPRPYDHLYIHSKYLGSEICRVFADYYGLEVPALLFYMLYDPELPADPYPFMISWPDTGRALRRALEVTSLPSPFEMVNISADLPHGRFDLSKAHSLLNWQPRDGLESFWQDSEAVNEPQPIIGQLV